MLESTMCHEKSGILNVNKRSNMNKTDKRTKAAVAAIMPKSNKEKYEIYARLAQRVLRSYLETDPENKEPSACIERAELQADYKYIKQQRDLYASKK